MLNVFFMDLARRWTEEKTWHDISLALRRINVLFMSARDERTKERCYNARGNEIVGGFNIADIEIIEKVAIWQAPVNKVISQ